MAQRHQTYFGVPIPPFKEEKIGAGSTTIRFVIKGKIPSKKNNEMAVAVRSEAKTYLQQLQAQNRPLTYKEAFAAVDMVYGKIVGNQKYKAFVAEIRDSIDSQKQIWIERLGQKGLSFPLYKASMTLRLYFKDKYVTDTVNKQQSIQDLLIDCGVIANDDYIRLNPIHSASACYKDELLYNIAFISLTFKL